MDSADWPPGMRLVPYASIVDADGGYGANLFSGAKMPAGTYSSDQ